MVGKLVHQDMGDERAQGLAAALDPFVEDRPAEQPDRVGAVVLARPATLRSRLAPENRGFADRKPERATRSGVGGLSVRSPRVTGQKATSATPSAAQACTSPSSGSRVASEYSDWTAATSCTASARRSEVGAISENPKAAILPALTKSASVSVTTSISSRGSRRWM